jgi:hypothetical protein
LAGEIEERLFDNGEGDVHLDNAIARYGRRFHLRRGAKDGLSLARLLTIRADAAREATPQAAIADLVRANHIREDVLEISQQELAAAKRGRGSRYRSAGVNAEQAAEDREREFASLAAMAEAWFGLGDIKKHERYRSKAMGLQPDSRRMTDFDREIGRLRKLLARSGSLLTPPWPGASAVRRIGARSPSKRTKMPARTAKERRP